MRLKRRGKASVLEAMAPDSRRRDLDGPRFERKRSVLEEVALDKTRINIANPQELLEIPGVDPAGRDAILRHRAAHGPIRDADELAQLLGCSQPQPAWTGEIDYDPADDTAPEAPGA